MSDTIDSAKTYNVLFLCTGNSARSILGEAIMNKLGAGRFGAWSAGSQHKGAVHPMALSVLNGIGVDIEGMSPKSGVEYAAPERESAGEGKRVSVRVALGGTRRHE